MISFGPRSILLLIGTVHGVVLAALLLRVAPNRIANRLLALLLALVALRVMPYVIGFAGFYDAYPWLSYFPYDWSLGYGALIWLYARVLCTGALPDRWKWHLLPALLQGVYYGVLFTQPLTVKNSWTTAIHDPMVVPIESAWALVAMAVYLALAWRAFARYQRWLDADLSNREDFRLTWLRLFLIAFAATLLIWTATVSIDAFVRRLTYFDRFPLYLWFSLLIYGLGLGGLRHATDSYPRPDPEPDAPAVAQEPAVNTIEPPTALDASLQWRELGEQWSRTVREEGWWRDADLTAPKLARHLATNTSYLSRALNDGLGWNFNEFVNRIRVEAVQTELARAGQNRDVLAIALDAGFNSKASFNRVFKRLTGETPTDFRRRMTSQTSQVR